MELGPTAWDCALWGSWVTAKPLQGTSSPADIHTVSSLVSLLEHPFSVLQGHWTCCLSPARDLCHLFPTHSSPTPWGNHHPDAKKAAVPTNIPAWVPVTSLHPRWCHPGWSGCCPGSTWWDRLPRGEFGSMLPWRRGLAQGFVLCPVYPAERNRGVQCAGISCPCLAPLLHESC